VTAISLFRQNKDSDYEILVQNIVALPYASDSHQKCLIVRILHRRKRIRKQKPKDGTACRTKRQLYACHYRQKQDYRQQPAAEKQIWQFFA
jgi:hypothetical protein